MTTTQPGDHNIATALAGVRERIDAAARAADRDPAHITLVAVSKTKPAARVAEALDAGQHDFGENYLQDALAKIETLAARDPLYKKCDIAEVSISRQDHES